MTTTTRTAKVRRDGTPWPIRSHGPGGYAAGCSCSTCRGANTARARRYRARLRARGITPYPSRATGARRGRPPATTTRPRPEGI